MGLVETLRQRMPTDNPALVSRRIALEEVIKVLTGEPTGVANATAAFSHHIDNKWTMKPNTNKRKI